MKTGCTSKRNSSKKDYVYDLKSEDAEKMHAFGTVRLAAPNEICGSSEKGKIDSRIRQWTKVTWPTCAILPAL
uniref:Uncharacterized protein n=1 Tax=Heterorhabditis bacteriophora TaxID=37862 RepID=A0A1I7WQJ9_HETBA